MTNEATVNTTRIGKRVRVLTGYSAHARFLAETSEGYLGEIPREAQIPNPYAYSPTHVVLAWGAVPVIIVETKHRRYEVFEVTGRIDPLEN